MPPSIWMPEYEESYRISRERLTNVPLRRFFLTKSILFLIRFFILHRRRKRRRHYYHTLLRLWLYTFLLRSLCAVIFLRFWVRADRISLGFCSSSVSVQLCFFGFHYGSFEFRFFHFRCREFRLLLVLHTVFWWNFLCHDAVWGKTLCCDDTVWRSIFCLTLAIWWSIFAIWPSVAPSSNFTDALPLVKDCSENNKRLIHFFTCEVAFILPCRGYKWMTFGETGTARSAIGSSLIYYGIPKGACIGIYFINRPEWLIVDHACAAYLYISMPLYDTLGPDAVRYIVNHAAVQ
ncbi:uncharacterized protein LOC130980317 [Arachis stenosperma]|uniref:uncharacterized protein LOC130980317 n=1 Tax=Arachis stenosperma TaxID=217475 RepID=UPI0025AC0B73|nr:uncharacterized protein LOC130980317 [Arachis stenosperma]